MFGLSFSFLGDPTFAGFRVNSTTQQSSVFFTVISGVLVFKGLLSWPIIKRLLNDTKYEKIQSLECQTENKDKNGVEKETGRITGHKMNGYVGNNYKAIGIK